MQPTSRRRLLTTAFVLTVFTCAPLSGCVAQSTNGAAGDTLGRVIVKFKDQYLQANSASVVAELERVSKARVAYLRPVGAGAHLYEIAGLRDQAALEQAVVTLNSHAAIEFAELDRLMKPAPEGSKP
jgi:hypothetical protein